MFFALRLMKVHPLGKSRQLAGPQFRADSALELFGAIMEFQERWARPAGTKCSTLAAGS